MNSAGGLVEATAAGQGPRNSPGCQPEALRLKSGPPNSLLKGVAPCLFSFGGAFNLLKNLVSAIIVLLYKRTFRKEKEVITFLIKP